MNWYIIIPVAFVLLALVYFLIKRNWKDEKNFKDQLNNDFNHSTKAASDIEPEDEMH